MRVRDTCDEGDALKIIERNRIDFAVLAVKLLYGKDSLSIAAELERSGTPLIWTYRRPVELKMRPESLRDRPTLKKPLGIDETREAITIVLAGQAIFDTTSLTWMRLT